MATDIVDLATAPTEANIANIPNLDRLSKLVSDINQQAWLSAPGRTEQLGVVQNMLAGNLDPQTIQENQLNSAQQYGARGFGADSGAWQSAIQRASGLSRQALQERGATAANALYSGMPTFDPNEYMVDPDLYATYQHNKAQEAQAAAALREQARQFNISTETGESQFTRTLQQRAAEAAQAAAQANAELAEKQREYNQTMSYQAGIDLQRLQENARQANQQAELAKSELDQEQSQFTSSQAQQQSQFGDTLKQRQTESATDSARQWAQLYAQLYGVIPGYNEQGQYTGQLGTWGTGTTGTAQTGAATNSNFLQTYNQKNLDRLRSYTPPDRTGWWTAQS